MLVADEARFRFKDSRQRCPKKLPQRMRAWNLSFRGGVFVLQYSFPVSTLSDLTYRNVPAGIAIPLDRAAQFNSNSHREIPHVAGQVFGDRAAVLSVCWTCVRCVDSCDGCCARNWMQGDEALLIELRLPP
jgi:hypothetical protein